MDTLANHPKAVIQQMAEDKNKVVDYLQSKDESKRPKGIKFVKPISLSTGGK